MCMSTPICSIRMHVHTVLVVENTPQKRRLALVLQQRRICSPAVAALLESPLAACVCLLGGQPFHLLLLWHDYTELQLQAGAACTITYGRI